MYGQTERHDGAKFAILRKLLKFQTGERKFPQKCFRNIITHADQEPGSQITTMNGALRQNEMFLELHPAAEKTQQNPISS